MNPLDRCDQEIAEIRGRTDDAPCWLTAMAEADWEAEKALIEKEEGGYSMA